MKTTLRIIGVLLVAGAGLAHGGDDFDLSWRTIDGGGAAGATLSTGGDFELAGTIGQPDAGALSGGEYQLTSGFWFEVVAGDCNADGSVNLLDYDDFEPCLGGPEAALADADCECFDFDEDDDVDLEDFGVLQVVFQGS